MAKGSDRVLEAGGVLIFVSIVFFVLQINLNKNEKKSQLKELIELDKLGVKERIKKKKASLKIPFLDKVMISVSKAGFEISLSVFLTINCFMMIVTFYIGRFFLDETLGFFTALLGPYLVWEFIQERIKKRSIIMLKDFRDQLRYMASSLRAGAPFSKALKKSAEKIKEPLKFEMLEILRNIQGGETIERALKEGLKKIPMEEYKTFVMATEIFMNIGGDLGKIYEKIARDIDNKIKRQENIKAYTAQGRLTTRVVGSIPFIVVGFIRIYSPEFYKPVANSPIWKTIYITCVCLIFFGIYWVKKMTNTFTKGVA